MTAPLTDFDTFIYAEMMVHPVLLEIESPFCSV